MSDCGREDSRLEADDPDYCKLCGWPLPEKRKPRETCGDCRPSAGPPDDVPPAELVL